LCAYELAAIAEAKDILVHKLFPDICNSVQDRVEDAYADYNTARVLIGHLSADPPQKVSRNFDQTEDGYFYAEIGTGIHGCRTVDLRPLLDRGARMTELDRQRAELQKRLDAVPDTRGRSAVPPHMTPTDIPLGRDAGARAIERRGHPAHRC